MEIIITGNGQGYKHIFVAAIYSYKHIINDRGAARLLKREICNFAVYKKTST